MAYKITDECTMCGLCADQCPTEAIREGESQYLIIQDNCIECGVCSDTCPVGAIMEE